ncbi:uncharacterized protein LOC132758652 [Ruditapes philippinarum]|uniref:uncharacterized protein LOC132758652 n=1 Tax=Ruditapes philippinarum TaxID=129788 RepID=UPI00295B79AF|nr:uncharacterized protein LOC132758652 [Ruditapes philippinarum]
METVLENLDFFTDDVSDFKNDLQRKLTVVGQSRDQERSKITRTTESMKLAIKKAEDKLLTENAELFTAYEHNLRKSIETISQLEKEITSVRSQVDNCLTSGTAVGSSDDRMIYNKFDSLQNRLASLQKGAVQPVFQPCEEDLVIVKNIDVGKFEVSDANIAPPIIGFPTKRTVDMYSCFITGFLWFNHMFVVSDKTNKKVKYFTEHGDFLCELLFTDASPYGICHMKDTWVAIALPKVRQIYIARLNNMKAEILNNFRTDVGYAGLGKGHDGNSLIASMASNTPAESHVDIIDFRGEVLMTFKNDPQLPAPIFNFPRYVEAFQGALIISDWRKDCVIFLHAASGSVLKEYRGTKESPLINPYDISLDKLGNVYVLNGKDGTVHVVDTQCNLTDVIRETSELLNPRLLAYNDEAGLLAVTYGAGDIKTYYHRVPLPETAKPSIPSHDTPASHHTPTSHHTPAFLSPPIPNATARSPSPAF